MLVVGDLLHEHGPEALRDGAVDLAVDEHRIDHAPAILDDHVLQDLQLAGRRLDLDLRDVRRVGVGQEGRIVGRRELEARVLALRQQAGFVVHDGACDLLQRHPLRRHAFDDHDALLVVDVCVRDLHQLRGDVLDALLQALTADHERAATGHRRAASPGPPAEGCLAGVTEDDLHVFERDSEPLGHHLRERGVLALPVRMRAERDGHLAARSHPEVRRLVRRHVDADRVPEARAVAGLLGVRADTDPAVDALRAELLVLLSQRIVVDQLERLLERLEVTARLVVHPGRRRVRELLTLDHVLPEELGGILADLAGRERDQVINDERRALAAHAPVDREGRLVRGDRPAVVLVVADVVRPGNHLGDLHRLERGGERVGAVRAGVADDPCLDAEDGALLVDRELALDEFVLGVEGGDEGLLAVLDPARGSPEFHRHEADDRLLGEDVALEPEAAADVRGDNGELVVREAKDAAELRTYQVGDLARRPVLHRLHAEVVIREAAAGLERERLVPAGVEPLLHHHRRLGERAGDVARAVLDVLHDVVAPLLVDERGAGLERLFGIGDDRQLIVVDVDQLDGILGDVPAFRGDNAEDVAHEARLVPRDRVPGARLEAGHDLRDDRRPDRFEAVL